MEVSSPHIGRLSFKSFIVVKTSVSCMSIFRAEAYIRVTLFGLNMVSYAFEIQHMRACAHMLRHTQTHIHEY